MEFAEIDNVQLEEGGVMFRYLLIQIERNGQTKDIVRGVNYQSYREGLEEKIVQAVERELRDRDFIEGGGVIKVDGGGSIALNPYQETVILFGSSQGYGVEQDRECVAKMLGVAYPEHTVSWFGVDDPKSKDLESGEDLSEEA